MYSKNINIFDFSLSVGSMSESHANLAEGLAVSLNCFQDITEIRESDMPTQKNCILIANSAPYSMPVQDCLEYENKTYEQLAGIFLEVFKNITKLN